MVWFVVELCRNVKKMPTVVAGMCKNVAQLCNYVTKDNLEISLPYGGRFWVVWENASYVAIACVR